MSISFKLKTSICDKFCKLIDKNVYEPMLCELMNASNLVFPGSYIHITEQSSGQCDFIETTTGAKFDAKLPFLSTHGKLIASNKRDFRKWLELVMDEEAEFGDDIIASRGKNIASLVLYKIMEARMESIEDDEHAIFFFPYPGVLDYVDAGILAFVSDYLDAIFRELKRREKLGTRRVYVIYPAVDGNIVLRCLNTNHREYRRFSALDEFITFDFLL